MKILVYPHDLGIGGSQLNAIEIAAQVQSSGHQCIIFGRPGPLVDRLPGLGLEFIESPPPGHRPSRRVLAAIVRTIRERGIDIAHGYEWPPALESWLSSIFARKRFATVSTIMSMSVAPFLPRSIPLVVGTEQIRVGELSAGRSKVTLIEPPVNLAENTMDDCRREAYRKGLGIGSDEICIVVVTRLAYEMKMEGIVAAISALPFLQSWTKVRLVVVGDGPARAEIESRACQTNRLLGFSAVSIVGEIDDPRPAYDAADIVIGMGGSALRGMAFQKPLVVQGEQGFWRVLTRDSVDDFLWAGWYGVGPGSERGLGEFLEQVRPLVESWKLRSELGEFSKQVVERFSLARAADRQIEVYEEALDAKISLRHSLGDAMLCTVGYSKYFASRQIAHLFGRDQNDDFNTSKAISVSAKRANRGK